MDGYGNAFPTITLSSDSLVAVAPRYVFSVTPDNTTVEADASVTFTVNHANAGSGTAGDVWLNLSLPAGFVYVSDTSSGTRAVFGSMYTWHWTDQATGPNSFTLQLLANPTVADQSRANLNFILEHTDENGNARPPATVVARVTFVAPVIELDLKVDRVQLFAGDTATFTLHLRNNGSAVAKSLWLLDSVDTRFEVVSYDSRVRAEGGPTLNWTFEDVLPGDDETVTLTLRIRNGVSAGAPIANVMEAMYTNSLGKIIGYARSPSQTVTVLSDPMPLFYVSIGGAIAAGAGVFFLRRRASSEIEDVFLVSRDGILMYHVSRSIVADKDEDVLTGMLTVVQEFVREAFQYGERRELHQVDFGDYRILIERGNNVYLAVVYSGPESKQLCRKVRSVLDLIEDRFGHVFESWDGDMSKIAGARDVIRESLLKPNGRVTKKVLASQRR